jgi:hypothetical protein
MTTGRQLRLRQIFNYLYPIFAKYFYKKKANYLA